MDRIADPNNPLRHIDEANWHTLARLFCRYRYDYACGVIKVYFLFTIDPEGATYATAMHFFGSMNVLIDGYRIVMLDGRHRRRSVKILCNGDGIEWALAPLCLRNAFHVDGKDV